MKESDEGKEQLQEAFISWSFKISLYDGFRSLMREMLNGFRASFGDAAPFEKELARDLYDKAVKVGVEFFKRVANHVPSQKSELYEMNAILMDDLVDALEGVFRKE
jgi:hypothetical protein